MLPQGFIWLAEVKISSQQNQKEEMTSIPLFCALFYPNTQILPGSFPSLW
jgi:hypothetical protein